MSDSIKHECGIALIRLRKPLQYYLDKYGTAFYGLNKMYLLMEKQHNRGQDGAGLANIKLNMPPGTRYISRYRSVDAKPIQDIFTRLKQRYEDTVGSDKERLKDVDWIKKNLPVSGEVFLGHLRYGTYGKNSIEAIHPFLRQNNWKTRNLIVAGNFNMTNVDELFQQLVELGQYPKEKADTVTIMEKIGHFLDEENDRLYYKYKEQGISKVEATALISENLNLGEVLRNASKKWDGGYAMAGMVGHGDAFVLRDPNGIRPAFYYMDDEVVVVTSERPVIQTAFNVPLESIKEVEPGHAIIIRKSGEVDIEKINEPGERKACSFERIYFSRGNDADIYQERIELGRKLVPQVLDAIDGDLDNTVFSFIPNTAEVSFYGLMKGLEEHLDQQRKETIIKRGQDITPEELDTLLKKKVRTEKIAWKDVKLRTFITEDSSRDELVSHVYDTTYGTVKPTDNLVVIDDSIVRGTTLKQSILTMLGRLKPKKIIVASSAPQIRFPDCYGIDMARMSEFIAFRAAETLLHETGRTDLINEVLNDCIENGNKGVNHVKRLFKPFTPQQISDKISEMLTPVGIDSEVKIVFQSIENLHAACPKNTGDWYFTGDYPTPGGMRVVNRAFVNYMEGRNERAY